MPEMTIEAHIHEVLHLLGLNPQSEGLEETPRRVAGYLREYIQPFDPKEILGKGFEAKSSNVVLQKNIPFRMICEHHLLPALGHAAIAYIPNRRVVGLSKLTRLVDCVGTERPGIQEDITNRIATLLHEHVDAKGTMVVTKAVHSCMACRGINSPGVETIVSACLGNLLLFEAPRLEVLQLIRG